MNSVTKKWVFLKVSSIILTPLMFWFIINFVAIYDQGYSDVMNFFIDPINKFVFGLFIIFAYFFSALSISEVFEDYISDHSIKNVANRLLFVSAIVIPLLTILSLNLFLYNRFILL